MTGNLLRLKELDGYNMNTLTRQVAGALALAHAVGIGHFNLKPQNILLNSNNGEVSAYVSDYLNYVFMPEIVGRYLNQADLSFIDPLQLLDQSGRPDPRYDVFSYAAILILLYEEKPSFCIRALNMAVLNKLYNVEFKPSLDSQSLRLYESTLKELDRVDPGKLPGRINRDFKACLGSELHSITGGLRRLIMESTTLYRDERPRSMIDIALRLRAV